MIRIAIGTVVAGVALVIAPASATIPCKSSAPRGVTASYRIIDGRKCWYVGRHLAKSRLAWRRMVRVVRVKRKPVGPAGETSGIEVTGAIDLSLKSAGGCWRRWRAQRAGTDLFRFLQLVIGRRRREGVWR